MFPSVSFLAIVLCHLSKSTYAQKELPSLNGVAGSTVVLKPDSVNDGIFSVTWKHNNDLAVEWFEGGTLEYYREFKKHASLNKPDGVLTIKSLTAALSGTYTVEINNKVVSSQKLQVFDPVPKPTILVTKVNETSYILRCDFDATQFVQIKWIIDDEETSEKYNKLTINEGTVSRSFVCTLINPVSNKSSDAVTNPFLTGSGSPGLIGIVVVIIILAVLAFLILVFIVVRPLPLLKDKPAVKRLRDSRFGKRILSFCSCLTANEMEEKNEANEMEARNEKDKLMNNTQPTGGDEDVTLDAPDQQQQLNVGTDDSANKPAAQGTSNHNLKETSAPEKDQN